MDVIDYTGFDDEYDRILEEADPCETCDSTEDLVLAIVTDDVEHFGKILLFCSKCHIDVYDDEEEFQNKCL